MSIHGLFLTIISAFLTIFGYLILHHSANTSEFTFSVFLKLFLMSILILGIILHFAALVVGFKVFATEVLSSCYLILVGITFFGVLWDGFFLQRISFTH
jgi:hypothetical protein